MCLLTWLSRRYLYAGLGPERVEFSQRANEFTFIFNDMIFTTAIAVAFFFFFSSSQRWEYKTGDLDISFPLPWEIVDKLLVNQASSVLDKSVKRKSSCRNSE